jgi:hypothetical protein
LGFGYTDTDISADGNAYGDSPADGNAYVSAMAECNANSYYNNSYSFGCVGI